MEMDKRMMSFQGPKDIDKGSSPNCFGDDKLVLVLGAQHTELHPVELHPEPASNPPSGFSFAIEDVR